MKKTILLFCSILLSLTVLAQESYGGSTVIKVKRRPEPKNSISKYISADTIISFPSETDLRGLVSNQWGNTVMFTTLTTNCKSDTVRLYSINAETFGVDTILIYIENLRKTIKRNKNYKISNIAFNKNFLVLHYASGFHIYNIINKQYTLYKEFGINTSVQNMQFLNDSILVMSEAYYSHTPPTHISLFNINTLSVEKSIFPHYNSLLLSNFSPQKNFDINGNTILWTNRAEYSFLVFDSQLQLQDSVYHPIKGWKTLPEKTTKKALKIGKYEAADRIAVIEKEYHDIDQLQWAFIIDSNHIATVHSRPFKNGHLPYPTIDIWSKTGEKWQISKSEIDDFAIISDTIQRNSFALDFVSGSEIHFVNNNKAVKLSKNGHITENPIGMPAQEYFQKELDGWQNSEPFLQVTIFSHTLTN